ncbi:hypothetical protein [Sphingomonas rhizophila]
MVFTTVPRPAFRITAGPIASLLSRRLVSVNADIAAIAAPH